MATPPEPKIYHIVHVDRLPSILADGWLWCDAEIVRRSPPGTTIGMNSIKERKVERVDAEHLSGLACWRLRANHLELAYRGGQEPIIHLEASLIQTVTWAEAHRQRWAFTLSNAGAYYFEDRCDLAQLDDVDWNAIRARDWRRCKEGKQAEFLIERQFPWELVSGIAVLSRHVHDQVNSALQAAAHKPIIEIRPDWYY